MSRYLRLWRPRSLGDYLSLSLVALACVGFVGVFFDGFPRAFLTGLAIGVAPACAVSAYWWQKQAVGRGKLFGALIWLRYSGERLESDYEEIQRNPAALTKFDALTIISSHAYNGRGMKRAAEEIERELREEIWLPPL